MSDLKIIKESINKYINKDILSTHRLLGGMSNFTYLIDCGEAKYTFRIPGKGAENFVDRYDELAVIKAIEPLNLMPKPIYFDVVNGYKLAPYVEGIVLNEISEKPYQSVAKLLKKLHSAPLFDNEYQPLQRLEKYEKLTNNEDVLYISLKNKWLEIYETLLSKQPLVATHGDSQVSNFIVDNEEIYLVDWEFAGNNDLMYDIACFGNANFEDAVNLLNAYFENPTSQDYQRLYGWRMFQCLQWHNVAQYKHNIGLSEELLVDFSFFAKAYLDKAKNFYQNYLDAVGDLS